MEYSEYQSLQTKNIHQVEWMIADYVKKAVQTSNWSSSTLVVAAAALASLLQEVKSKDGLLELIESQVKDEVTGRYLNQLVSDHFDGIQELSVKFDSESLTAVALFTDRSADVFDKGLDEFTPDGISKLAIALLDIVEDDIVLDLGSGSNAFLIQTSLASSPDKLYGVEINTDRVIVGNIRSLLVDKPIQTVQGNIISQSFTNLHANKVFSNTPLGMRWKVIKREVQENPDLNRIFKDTKLTVSGDWVYSLAAILNQKRPGKTIVLMTNAGTWNKSDEAIRKLLLAQGLLEGVILLPANLLSYSSIPLTMLVFSADNKAVKMVNASDIFTAGRRQNTLEQTDLEKIIEAYNEETEISKFVPVSEIVKQEYIINPQRHVTTEPTIKNGIPLGEVCVSINRGANLSSRELDELASVEETAYQYVMLQNIHDGVIDVDLPNLKNISSKDLRYSIPHDSLIVSKLAPFKIARAKVPEGKSWLANGNLYFLEIDAAKANPSFVECFMQSEAGIAQLNLLAKGTTMKSISIQDLRTVNIPNVSREIQDRIADEYETLSEELVVLKKQKELISEKKARLIEEVL